MRKVRVGACWNKYFIVLKCMAIRRQKISMNTLVGNIEKERLGIIFCTKPLLGVIREFISDVTFLCDPLPINIKTRIRSLGHKTAFRFQHSRIRNVNSLAFETEPVVEATLFLLTITHMPLSNEGCLVTGTLKKFRKEG